MNQCFRPTLILCALLAPTLAVAQRGGTEAEQQACTPDVFRLCSEYIPDEGQIVACLQAKRAQLSPACLPVIFPTPVLAAPVEAIQKAAHHKHHRKHHSQK